MNMTSPPSKTGQSTAPAPQLNAFRAPLALVTDFFQFLVGEMFNADK